MIIEFLFDVCLSIIFGTVSIGEVVALPVELLGVLTTLLQYGVWVVGVDVIALVFSTIFFWWGLKASLGLVIFVWKLLPLT